MKAQEIISFIKPNEIDEARMGASDFASAVEQGAAKGVLVGFEFEVLVPQTTIEQYSKTVEKSITVDSVADLK